MKTIIIIIIICSVLYCIGIGQDQPAPKAPARNRTAETIQILRSWMGIVDDWQATCQDPELSNGLKELYNKLESGVKFGTTAKELIEYRSEMKHYFKILS